MMKRTTLMDLLRKLLFARQRRILRYKGKIGWEGDLNEMRRGRKFD